ncbi:MAG: tetratricopeptide repeat protein [Candidatus Acidiferrales bacterium]
MNARCIAVLFAAIAGGGTVCSAATPDQCHEMTHRGQTAEAHKCYEALTQESQPYLKAEGYWGLKMYQDSSNAFREAVAGDAANAMYRVRWGMLFHERFNNNDAAGLFNEALQRDPKNPQAYYGLALLSADGYDNKAPEYATKAATLDSKFYQAHALLASLHLEDSDTNGAIAEADAALKISPEALDAMAIHAAVELLADRSPDEWIQKMLAVNPSYGEGYELIAHHLMLNRRYNDAIAYYRKAIAVEPDLWSAHSQLGVNLMRLGQDVEAYKELELAYNNGFTDFATSNSLKLLDSNRKNFVTVKDGAMLLKFDKKQADALTPYYEQVMKDAMAAYSKKYQMTLPDPVQVEVYPNHEDFAVRTLGLPGLGALGVTFGEVVAMDSPGSGPEGSKPGDNMWASTLRHEMSHVYVLTATDHRVPRWFTEGLAVHEETQASPLWGDAMTPEIVVALRDKKLLPVAELDKGFVRPTYGAQVIVSYYQAGKICDYIQDHWGADKLLGFIHSYAKPNMTTEQAFQENLDISPADFDKQFLPWIYGQTAAVTSHFDDWHNQLKALAAEAEKNDYDAVLKDGPTVIQLYPEYVYDANAYEFVAAADLAKGNKQGAEKVLAEYQTERGRRPNVLEKLASLQQELGDVKGAAVTYQEIDDIDPLIDTDYHSKFGHLLMQQKDYFGAIREFSAVVAMTPLDKAGAEYDLATAYMGAGERDKAQDSVLASLEAAPDYRPALKMLLELQDAQKGR